MEDFELDDEDDEYWDSADYAVAAEDADYFDGSGNWDWEDPDFWNPCWDLLDEMGMKKYSGSKWNIVIDCRNDLISSLKADFKEKAQVTASGVILDGTASDLVDRFMLLLERIRQLLRKWPRFVKKEVRVFETLALLVAYCFRFMKLTKKPKKAISKQILQLLEEYEAVSGTRDLTILPNDSGATNVARNPLLPRPSLFGERRASGTSNPRKNSGCPWCEGYSAC